MDRLWDKAMVMHAGDYRCVGGRAGVGGGRVGARKLVVVLGEGPPPIAWAMPGRPLRLRLLPPAQLSPPAGGERECRVWDVHIIYRGKAEEGGG